MIEVEQLGKRFGAITAVHDLSFGVGEGEIFGLLGPNGAGKTTTVRMLAGLIAPSAGRATIGGIELGERTQAIRAMTGILTESPGLHEKLTARQNLAYYGRLYGLRGQPLREAVERYLGVVGLGAAAARRVAGFSKGMRQRVAIARALMCKPAMLLLDEPFSALDALTRDQMNVVLQQVQRAEKVTTLLITHSIQEAVFLSNRVLVMSGRPGRILDEIEVPFPQPRRLSLREDPAFGAIAGRIRLHFERTGVLVG
jgi:NitT/TauT family transport system ATP-binding protein